MTDTHISSVETALGKPAARHGEALRYFQDVVLPYEGDECLIWPYSRNAQGYGFMSNRSGLSFIVSRRLCAEVYGPPPEPHFDAAHSCGNGHLGCVSKNHLRWATRRDNLADMDGHGTKRYGESAGRTILTEVQVTQIRLMKGSGTRTKVGRTFGVAPTTIGAIWAGKIWKRLPWPAS